MPGLPLSVEIDLLTQKINTCYEQLEDPRYAPIHHFIESKMNVLLRKRWELCRQENNLRLSRLNTVE